MEDIDSLIVHTLKACQAVMINDRHCFELYGYDVIIDDDLNSWLLEVNASPSLSASTKHDYTLKCGMLSDMLDIVDMERRNTTGEVEDHVSALCL